MNKYYTEFQQPFGVGSRDPVFKKIQNEILRNKPAKILEIGSIRDVNSKDGDGWSTFYWAEHVEKHGGKIVVCDIDEKAIKTAKEMLSDFVGKIDIQFIVDDGINWIGKETWDLIFLDGADDPNQMYEQYKKINRTKTDIICDDFHGKGVRLQMDYKDYQILRCNHIHLMAAYLRVSGNNQTFKIGNLELNYVREDSNSAWRNERSVELGLGKWFTNKYPQVVELGAVCYQYSFFNNWEVVDPYDNGYSCIKSDILDYNYIGKNIISISTIEHCGIDSGYNQPIIKDLAIKGLEKIVKESANYLITFPIGANRDLEDYLKTQTNIKYTFMVRDSKRGETNNWHQEQNNDLFYENYLHFDYGLDYYGSAHVICVITNQEELLKSIFTKS